MAKDSGEFVEVFRRVTAGDRAASKGGPGSTRSGPRRRPEYGEPGASSGIQMNLSLEALVISVFVLLCVVVASYVLGYRRGRTSSSELVAHRPASSAQPATSRPAPANNVAPGPDARSLSLRAAPGRKVPFHTVRIIAGIRLDRAREIRDDLRQKGYDAFVTKSRNTYAVNIGEFAGLRDPAAAALRDKFANLQYNGGKWFGSSYIVQIQNERSLLK